MENIREFHLRLSGEYAAMLQKFLGGKLRAVCLFGSAARGDFKKDSDIDLLVIADELPEDVGSRHSMFNQLRMEISSSDTAKKLRNLGYSTSISEIYLTPDEAEKHPPIMLDIVEDGIIIYDVDNFLRKVLKEIKERLLTLGARRVQTSKGWYWVLKPDARLGEEIRI